MCGGSRLGFDRDGGAEVENGREEEMRKKREKDREEINKNKMAQLNSNQGEYGKRKT